MPALDLQSERDLRAHRVCVELRTCVGEVDRSHLDAGLMVSSLTALNTGFWNQSVQFIIGARENLCDF